MVPESIRDFFVASASVAGALIGLLFVAISVASERLARVDTAAQRYRVRAAAALTAFTNALAVSLFALVPDTNAGYPALVMGVVGILFSAAGLRSILSSGSPLRERWRQYVLITFLLAIFGAELVAGIVAAARPSASAALQVIGYALITSVLVGIARAWEIVGDRDTGVLASLAVLTGRTAADGAPAGTQEFRGHAEPGPDAPTAAPPE